MKNNKMIDDIIISAIDGNRNDLETIIVEIKDFVFNISLRMLGTIADAEDATQEILIKVITNLSSFKGSSKFETWIYRISVNYLIDYKKSMFAQYPLSFDYYENDLSFTSQEVNPLFDQEEREKLGNELKLSCTNVMLQCLKPLDRCIFIMGTMFHLNSQWASEILEISAENYRKRLSRSRKKMQSFLLKNCQYAGGSCKCDQRIEYAISRSRLNPSNLEYTGLNVLDKSILNEYAMIMNSIEDKVDVFENLSLYDLGMDEKTFLNNMIKSKEVGRILNFSKEETI